MEACGFVDYMSHLKEKHLIEENFSPPHCAFLPTDKNCSLKPTVESNARTTINMACFTLAHLANQFQKLLEREQQFLTDCQKWKCGGNVYTYVHTTYLSYVLVSS